MTIGIDKDTAQHLAENGLNIRGEKQEETFTSSGKQWRDADFAHSSQQVGIAVRAYHARARREVEKCDEAIEEAYEALDSIENIRSEEYRAADARLENIIADRRKARETAEYYQAQLDYWQQESEAIA